MARFYAVHSSSAVGVFDSWPATKMHVDRVRGAVHRSFPTEQEARDWLAMHQVPPPAAVVAAPPAPHGYDDGDGDQTPPSAPLAEDLPFMGRSNKRERNAGRGSADVGHGGYLLDEQEDLGLVRAAEPLSAEQEAVVQVCLAGHNVLIVGEAGTGKSHLLRALIERLQLKHGQHKVFCAASTGILRESRLCALFSLLTHGTIGRVSWEGRRCITLRDWAW
jgi:hypothetical protein